MSHTATGKLSQGKASITKTSNSKYIFCAACVVKKKMKPRNSDLITRAMAQLLKNYTEKRTPGTLQGRVYNNLTDARFLSLSKLHYKHENKKNSVEQKITSLFSSILRMTPPTRRESEGCYWCCSLPSLTKTSGRTGLSRKLFILQASFRCSSH